MSNLFFSFIVPVYNIKEYLAECIKSLKQHDYFEYEIILVDDGSTDGSGELCDELAQEVENVKVCHKKNGGAADARNYGIKAAKGDYIIFVDGDDWIDNQVLSKYAALIQKYGQVDILIDNGMYTRRGNDEYIARWYDEYVDTELTGKQCFEIVAVGVAVWSPCGKAFRRLFWLQHDFNWAVGRECEDFELTYKVIYYADRVMFTGDVNYYYREGRIGSVETSSCSIKHIEDKIYAIKSWEAFLKNESVSDKARLGIQKKLRNSYIDLIYKANKLDKKDRSHILKELYKMDYLMVISGTKGDAKSVISQLKLTRIYFEYLYLREKINVSILFDNCSGI